ncbi:MAG: LysR family transcriptional regulator [Alphaproteobacteria bacterium]|nr:LysR family transcriptional regulator [Alphaproteobacteria bacterium]
MRHPLGNISITMLRAFEALYLHKKATIAADKLGLSQPSLSVYLKSLRELTGDPLFVRTAKGMEPTDFCHAYYHEVKSVLDSLEHLLSHKNMKFDPRAQAVTFSTVIPIVKSRILFQGLCLDLRQEYPLLNTDMLHMSQSEAFHHLETGLVDVYLGIINDPLEKQFSTIRAFGTDLIVMCSNKSRYFKKGRISKAEYLGTPHIKSTESFEPSALDVNFKRHGLLQKKMISVPDIWSEMELLRESDFLLVIDRSDAQFVNEKKRFKILKTDFSLPQFDFHMVWHSRKNSDAAHKWYREYIMRFCKTNMDDKPGT